MKFQTLLAVIALTGTLALVGCENHTGTATEPATTTMSSNEASGTKSKAETFTEANFDETIKTGVVLVDFWATWCPPCRTQGPIVDEVAGKVAGTATVGKLDVDQAKNISKKYGITSIPTLIIFKDGKKVKQFVGVTQADELVKAIKDAAGK